MKPDGWINLGIRLGGFYDFWLFKNTLTDIRILCGKKPKR